MGAKRRTGGAEKLTNSTAVGLLVLTLVLGVLLLLALCLVG